MKLSLAHHLVLTLAQRLEVRAYPPQCREIAECLYEAAEGLQAAIPQDNCDLGDINAQDALVEALTAALTWMQTMKTCDPNIHEHGPLSYWIGQTKAALSRARATRGY